MKSEFKIIRTGIIILVAAALAGMGCLCLVYMLPTGPMKANVTLAYDLFMDERVNHDWSNDVEFTRLDGYTDMIMYGTAIYEGKDNVLTEALMNRRMDKRGEEAMDLADYLSGKPGTYEPQSYERYWHGYLIWLKPLLLFMHPRNIRVFNMILQITLFAYFLQLMAIRFNGKYFIPVVASVILLNPVSTAMCLQYSSIYYISIIASILELKHTTVVSSRKWFSIFFLVIGICVAYFDFLTYPPIALCFPLLVYLMKSNNGENDYKLNNVEAIIRAGVYWGCGYIGMWGIKWILPLLVGYNQFSELFHEISYRSDIDSSTLIGLVIDKIKVIAIKPFLVFFAFIFVYYLIVTLRDIMQNGGITLIPIEMLVSYVLVGVIPIAWYFVARQHSSHTFAYRDIVGTIMPILIILEEFRCANMEKSKRHESTNC